MCFLFPYLVAELILGNSYVLLVIPRYTWANHCVPRRAVLVRLEAMESIVSQHPVFQSLQMYVRSRLNHAVADQ